ncbi:c-type cytochrome biogenesis protein CcmI [Methylomicrobium album]|uniref:Cytochrome c-type biogenesis protein CcmI n=1 Tax=Methylomicrobium album BG8 TaxID=686340 RepID=H8GH57_METAL|nr:c-type cytochrome biogenesis protein CcmI [Methylomicrobium album]EIC28848.1 cytochrome c-type biogenesis protein CcmI [Methylomicrobium album BG8]
MNLVFFLIAGVFMLAAFAFVLPPLWRARELQPSDLDHRNIEIARSRLAELKSNLRAGGITRAQFDEQAAELELALSDDLSIESRVKAAHGRGRWMAYVVALAVPLLAGSLYFSLGRFDVVGHGEELAKAAPDGMPTAADIEKMVAGLAEKMKANPDNAEGWLMLGKSYKYLEQYPKAADAFANAYRLLGDKPEVMLLYADALAFAADKNLAGKPSELIFKALELEPENPNGLWLAGLSKVQQGDPKAAAVLWRKLESLLPEGSEPRKEMQNIIAGLPGQAQAAAGEPKTPPATVPAKSITVEVGLAPELRSSASPDDTVFIYAQAPSGPKMPLAIVRKQVSDLPLKVTLDDSTAMMPAMKLSNFGEVKLLARISKSGQAVAQPGDLIGTVENAAMPGRSEYKILINQQM